MATMWPYRHIDRQSRRRNHLTKMKSIDLTSTAKALAYLKSLPADSVVEIIDGRRALTNAATDAVSKLVGESAHNWANNRDRWTWTAGELVATIEAEMAGGEE
jgi:plasmid maintenance system antidote protein VapI